MFSWCIQIHIIKLKQSHCWKLDDARIFSVLSDYDSQLTLQHLSMQTKYHTVHFWQPNGICIKMLCCILSMSQSVKLKEWELFVFLFISEIGSFYKPVFHPNILPLPYSEWHRSCRYLIICCFMVSLLYQIAWYSFNCKKTVISCLVHTCCN